MSKVLIVEAPYYEDIVGEMTQGAVEVLEEEGYDYDRVQVTGALEIPLAIRMAAETGKYTGFVALGCVIRGETVHFDLICQESFRGLMTLGVEQGLIIGNGILTVEDDAQAYIRADREQKNKGGEAAWACVKMLELQKIFGKSSASPVKPPKKPKK